MVQVEQEVLKSQANEDGVQANKTIVSQKSRSGLGFKIEELVYLVTAVVELLLFIRVVLSLFGANQDNAFASFIYSWTYPIVAPFFGLFSHTFAYGVSRLEVETLVAMLVVAGIGWVLGSIVTILRK